MNIRWVDDIETALKNLGGEAHLSRIYEEVRKIRSRAARSVPESYEATIRQALESHCPDSDNFRGIVLFRMVSKGSGIWALPMSPAQQSYLHLNPVVEKLSQGKHVFGVSTSDFSLQNARSLARDPDIDFVYLDMEHGAMRFDQLEVFLSGMMDKAGILERGNAQAHPAVFARFAPYASEEAQWVVKHALDLGLMGILINNVETAEQAENIVRTMRYMPARDSKFPEPRGVRGTAGAGPWFWGISGAEYRRRADLWPLNPEGDLVFWPMIETVEGVKNADAIAQVPGVGGFYVGAAQDLSNSLGVPDPSHPDVDAAMAEIIEVCRARSVPVGGTVGTANVAERMGQGYQIISFGGANGGLSAHNEAVRTAALAAGARR